MIGSEWLGEVPPGWRVAPLWSLFKREKILGRVDEPMVSVFREHGVVFKSSRENLNQTAEDRSIYQLVDSGWLVVNRMKAWQGSVGVSGIRGIVSGHYICFRPIHSEDDRFLNHLLRSPLYTAMFAALSRGVRPGQIEIDNDVLASLPVLLPPQRMQASIADLLDDQTARIDNVMKARRQQGELVEAWATAAYQSAIFAGGFPLTRLSKLAEVRLGRQRAPQHETGKFMTRYLRSANVLDGRIDLSDVKAMNFEPSERAVFTLKPGDVLVTEGAGSAEAVGAAAVWDGRENELCFQNTLLRVRPKADSVHPDFLGWWARTAHRTGAMRAYATGASILHLGSEGLRTMPVPSLTESGQLDAVRACRETELTEARLTAGLAASVARLTEFRLSLCSAAVSGEIDVSSASGREVPA